MKVKKLIKLLKLLPHDAEVYALYDGEPRLNFDEVKLTEGGRVILKDSDEKWYSEDIEEDYFSEY